ncbi:MAG: hypothetical protein JJU29_03720 [Verrucomicrobia bacterium]|nr:hypothetical protein [Verrucomicrobiota bacterium]MCH8510922.1 type II and III secretion system protein [Kiritimatiellia bacterium]
MIRRPLFFAILFVFAAHAQEAVTEAASDDSTEFITRAYHIPPTRFGDPFAEFQVPSADRGDEALPWARKVATEADTLEFFASTFNIDFPEGSRIRVLRATTGLTVILHNTRRNHERFQTILRLNGVWSANIRVVWRVVSMPNDVVDPLEREAGGDLDDETLLDLWKQGHGENLATQTLMSINGANNILTLSDEIIYPADMDTHGEENPQVIYGNFQKRDAGFILNVTPVIQPGFETISLTLLPEVVEYRGHLPNVPETLAPLSPLFRTLSYTGSIEIPNGGTRMVGMSNNHDGTHRILMFIGATAIEPDGTPVKPLDTGLFQE